MYQDPERALEAYFEVERTPYDAWCNPLATFVLDQMPPQIPDFGLAGLAKEASSRC
jgi:hypothetical protein